MQYTFTIPILETGTDTVSHNNQKKIAVINDICGFGRCAISAALPIISAMKIQCCPLPTAIFSNHTGYKSFYCADFTAHMDTYMKEWEKLGLRFNGILSGFLGSEEQLDIVIRFFNMFAEDAEVVVDPVMGDHGKLYSTFSPALAARMKELLPYAKILTPNLTEACILTDTPYRRDMDDETLCNICGQLSAMGPEKIVVSGLESGDDLVNFVFVAGKAPMKICEHKVGACRSGTGDVFSSIIAADAVNGIDFGESVCHASAFIAKVLRRAVEMQIPEADGICFEEFLCEL